MVLMSLSFLVRFAVTYDCQAYGTSTYSNNDPCTAGNGLAGTGTDVYIALALGVVLVLAGIVAIVKLRRKNTKNK